MYQQSEMRVELRRRHEFVSEGMQASRLLEAYVESKARVCLSRLLGAASDWLIALGAWLRRRQHLDSVHG